MVTFLGMIISTISYLKYMSRGDVLQLTDISFLTKMGEVTDFLDPKLFLNWPLITSFIIATIFGVFLIILIKECRINTKIRITLPIISLLFITLLFGTKISQGEILPIFGLDTKVRYSLENVHEMNGVVLGLYNNFLLNKVEIPVGYSQKAVFNILDEVKIKNRNMTTKPNVIVIMSESFFDPTVLPNIEFNKDPIPNIRKLISNYTSGKLITPTFAGGTSNVEFEVFTGNITGYLPYSTYPYSDMTNRFETNIPTIQKDFKANGYETIAVHTYDAEFYSRHKVYPNLGFDKFISQSEIDNHIYRGLFLSDETFVNEIINQIENSKEPLFLFGLSMQNHTPFSMEYYEGSSDVEIVSEGLSEVARDKMTAYVKGINDTDKMIQKLIDYIDNSETPTVLLFYGDHLPSQYETYLETGFVSTKVSQDWNTEEMYKIHSIPFFIYDNFNIKEEYSQNEMVGAAFLGNYLSNYVEIKKSIYFNFLDSLEYISYRDRLFVDKDRKAYVKPTKEYITDIEKHKMLEYDILYGNQYINDYSY